MQWDDEHTWGEQGLDGQAGYIHHLATRNAFRGQKLGVQIMEWTYRQIRTAGRSYARLDCLASNLNLCTYYENQDFRRLYADNKGHAFYERSV